MNLTKPPIYMPVSYEPKIKRNTIFCLKKTKSICSTTTFYFCDIIILSMDGQYCIFADIRYADIFQLILADTDIFPFVWKQHNKSLLCRNYKQNIFMLINNEGF